MCFNGYPINRTEVQKAISQLNTKKPPDELGLTAEHLKYAGNLLIDDITDIFNQIICEKEVPELFKSGILTPVLKSLKIQQTWTIIVELRPRRS